MIEGKFAVITGLKIEGSPFLGKVGEIVELRTVDFQKDKEVHVLNETVAALKSLQPEERNRVMVYLLSRFPIN